MSVMSKKKLDKKQQRAKDVKKKILARREAIRAPKIEENSQRKKAKRISKLMKDMGELNVWADDVLMKMDNSTISQLEKNAQILQALEQEYEAEKAKKNILNEELRQKGLITLEEKLGFLHQELVNQQRAAGEAVLGPELALLENREASNIKIDKPRREVAEVTICKAPDFVSETEIKEISTED